MAAIFKSSLQNLSPLPTILKVEPLAKPKTCLKLFLNFKPKPWLRPFVNMGPAHDHHDSENNMSHSLLPTREH